MEQGPALVKNGTVKSVLDFAPLIRNGHSKTNVLRFFKGKKEPIDYLLIKFKLIDGKLP